jgi:hypothetical protein
MAANLQRPLLKAATKQRNEDRDREHSLNEIVVCKVL